MGAAIARSIRQTDVAARYGGEEFLILLPDADGEAVGHVAERIRANIAGIKLFKGDSHRNAGADPGSARVSAS